MESRRSVGAVNVANLADTTTPDSEPRSMRPGGTRADRATTRRQLVPARRRRGDRTVTTSPGAVCRRINTFPGRRIESRWTVSGKYCFVAEFGTDAIRRTKNVHVGYQAASNRLWLFGAALLQPSSVRRPHCVVTYHLNSYVCVSISRNTQKDWDGS